MSIPPQYTNCDSYFKDVLNFLHKYSWLYNFPNTHILVNKVLDNFPNEWLPFLKDLTNEELNQLPYGIIKENCPESLKIFYQDLRSLKHCLQRTTVEIDFKFHNNSGLNGKKKHEIISLAPLIADIYESTNCNFIVDVGSGLGYLSQLLYGKYNYNVLGIEGNSKNVDLARDIQEKYYASSKSNVKYAEHFITDKSAEKIVSLVRENFPEKLVSDLKICIVGLHACADLSVTILELFSEINHANSLVIMPCCYHRIELDREENAVEFYRNFPASCGLKSAFNEIKAERFLRRHFLRLSCQQTEVTFSKLSQKEHEERSKNCMFRAILQDVAILENCEVKRLKRKSGRYNKHDNDFSLYVDNLKNTHVLVYPETAPEKLVINDLRFKEKMLQKWQDHKDDCYLVEVLTGFQAAIQSICENIVLLDRVQFLKEKGLQCCVRKVTDDCISPRCYALVATKHRTSFSS